MLMVVPELGNELDLFLKIKVVACLEAGFTVAHCHCELLEHISNVIDSHPRYLTFSGENCEWSLESGHDP